MGGTDSLLTTVLEGMDHGVVIVDAGLRLVAGNDAWRTLFRLEPGAALAGRPMVEVVEERLRGDLPEAERESIRQLMMGGLHPPPAEPVVFTVERPNGRIIEARTSPLPTGGLLRTFTDVTAERRREKELLQTQERYWLALRSFNEGMYDWDIASQTIFFSDRLRELFGIPDADISPDDWVRRILPDDMEHYRAALRAHLKGETDKVVCEYRFRRDDGQVVWVRQHGIAFRDEHGRAVRLTGSGADVTEYRNAIEALRESEERHMVAMRSLDQGAYDWDLESDSVHITDDLKMLLRVELLTGKDWYGRIDEQDREVFLEAQRALFKGEVDRLECEYRIEVDGHVRWVRQHGIAIRDGHGRVTRMIGSAGDITERKVAELALQASQLELRRERELLGATLENMDQGIMMADAHGCLLAFNHRFSEMMDLPPEMLRPGLALADVVRFLCDRGDIPLPVDEAVERLLGEKACRSHRTTTVRRPDGRILESRNVPLDDGGFVRTFTDMTERSKAEDAVRELIEAMPLPLVVSSLVDHRDLYVNEHAAKAYGIGVDTGDDVFNLYVDPAQRQDLLARLDRDGSVDGFEALLETRSGTREWVLMSARRLTYQGQRAALVASHVITERKRLESDLHAAKEDAERALQELKDAQASLVEAEKMASLGGLVAGIAHEINTPVGIALTAASHLQEKTNEIRRTFEEGAMRKQDFATYVSVAENACRLLMSNATRAANLIQSFKQVAVDQTSDERRRFDLKDYIAEVFLSLGPKLKRTNHRIEVDVPEGLVVDSYPGPFAQVLTNLVMNSLVHGFEHKDDGTIRVAVAQTDDDTVELSYSDNGKGIPRANLKRIFDPFFTTKRGMGGSGLGLNIVYNIITKRLSGTVKAESEVGVGTTFTLRMPMSAPRESAEAIEAGDIAETAPAEPERPAPAHAVQGA